MESEPLEHNKNNNFLNNGLLIALFPGYAYLLAFSYEYGYCSHFGVPIFLISPSISSILIIISVIILFVLSNLKLFGIITPVFRILKNPKYQPYHSFIKFNTLFAVAFLIIFFIYKFYWSLLITILIMWAFYVIVYFAPVWFFDLKKKSLKERFEEYDQKEDKLDLLLYASKYINRSIINYSLLAILIIGLSFLLGNGEAYKQEYFYVMKNDSTQVVLRTYNDLLICSRLDYKKKMVNNSYTLLNTKSNNILEFNKVKIGSLTLEAEKTIEHKDMKLKLLDSINVNKKETIK